VIPTEVWEPIPKELGDIRILEKPFSREELESSLSSEPESVGVAINRGAVRQSVILGNGKRLSGELLSL
jgi:hypothetical protein